MLFPSPPQLFPQSPPLFPFGPSGGRVAMDSDSGLPCGNKGRRPEKFSLLYLSMNSMIIYTVRSVIKKTRAW